MNEYISLHNLDFEVAPWVPLIGTNEGFEKFRVGTCHGLWKATDENYELLAIFNEQPGNGHFEDVMGWFENSCQRDGKSLLIMEFWNEGFKNHLLRKRGFVEDGPDNVIKHFNATPTASLIV